MIEGQFDGTLFGPHQPCFGCGPEHPFGFRLKFERQGDDVVTAFTPTNDHQGPPGIFHGGLVATLADELAAWAIVSHLGQFGFTVALEGRYKKAIRVGTPVEGRARLTTPPGRLVGVEVTLSQGGEPAFTSAFKFAILDQKAAEKLLGGPIPEGWARFARDRK